MPTRSKSYAFHRLRAAHLRLGRRGERLAVRAIEEAGFEVLVRNYRCTEGEIDIVARENAILCFIEVKTRRRLGFGRPADAVGRGKRRHIIRAAHRYLREIGRPPIPHRFDIIEVVLDGLIVRDLQLHRAAFTDAERPRFAQGRFPALRVHRERSGTEGKTSP